jgi:multimeric flavodoxin WrbA
MKRLAVIYHSDKGHTARFAGHVAKGARTVSGVDVALLTVDDVGAPDALAGFDGLILGSPTYLGGVSGRFKSFMDSTGMLWRMQKLKGKLAGGFTVSSLPSGDKLTALLSMIVFSLQHGMIWIGNPFLPETRQGVADAEAANRLGSWAGAMGQAAHDTPPDLAFPPGDLRTAEMFGENFARTLARSCL